MAASVSLSTGRAFESIKSAKLHFVCILNGRALRATFSGEELADVEVLFLDYCIKTDWPLPSRPTSFYPTHSRGPRYTTRCFGVTFEDGTTGNFSLDKAIRAIAA